MQFKTSSRLSLLAAFSLTLVSAQAGVVVGGSTLFNTLQYSDTFTVGPTASSTARQAYVQGGPGSYPLPPAVAVVEKTYGNPTQSWDPSAFSINSDTTPYTGENPYPNGPGSLGGPGGVSAAGSDTGITQSQINPGTTSFGLGYNLSSDFVVQADAAGGVGVDGGGFLLDIGNTADYTATHGLSVIFGVDGHIALYNQVVNGAGLNGTDTLLTYTPSLNWRNYAVEFNLTSNTLNLYFDQTSIGTVNLNAFDSGAYAAQLNGTSNDYVGLGYHNAAGEGKVLWTDNFQVGTFASVPEPSTWVMMLGSLVCLGVILRRRSILAKQG